MSETINTTMYDRVDEVRNLNRIEGFDPRQYMRNLTGSDGTVKQYLDVVYRKLWFRLKNPDGKIVKKLLKLTEQTAIVCDRDSVIAAAGGKRRELLEKPVSAALEQIMEQRGLYRMSQGAAPLPVMEGGTDPVLAVAAPILAEGDVLGCVAFVSNPSAPPPGEVETKLAQTVAGFLGRQMEG